MKKFRLIVCAAAAMLLGTLNAGATTTTIWKGNTLSTVQNASGDGAVLYLYNVGTGQFMDAGNNWGTELSMSTVGSQFGLAKTGQSYYHLSTRVTTHGSGGSISYVGVMDGSVHGDNGHLYVDRAKDNYGYLTISSATVSESDVKYPTNAVFYTIKSNYSGGYLTAVKDGIVKVASSQTDLKAVWQIVTLADIKEHFKDTEAAKATEAAPADGTFAIYDAQFSRKNEDIKYWKTGSSMNATLSNSDARVLPSEQTDDYYVGNGYKKDGDDGDIYTGEVYTSNGKSTKSQFYFGGLWTANIHCTNGQITQSVTPEVSGWYIITCEGFTTVDGAASLFAYAQNGKGSDGDGTNASSESVLPYQSDAPATYARAGQLLKDNGNGSYTRSVMIYVNEGETIYFGVKTAENNKWTCVDNFQIKYCGNVKEYLVLSELETSMDYINAQVDDSQSYPMVLERGFTAGQWNSFILPVDMSAQQVKKAFGGGTKLSKIVGMNKETNWYRLNFQSVDLKDDKAEGIVAGTLYIIKPALAPSEEASEESPAKFTVRNMTDKTITIKKPYYLINQMALKTKPENENGIVKQENVPGNDEITGKLTFKGTYTNQTTKVIPAHSFVLSSKTGVWYLTTSESYTVKGFRTWIETEKLTSDAQVSVFNDGVEMGGGEVTGISNVLNDLGINANKANKVYSINGQLVRSGSASLEGLAKGVYIVNGNKYIVK